MITYKLNTQPTAAPAAGVRRRSGWDLIDNVDDALDVLGMVGKSMNVEAVGRQLMGEVTGAAANLAGGTSGAGW